MARWVVRYYLNGLSRHGIGYGVTFGRRDNDKKNRDRDTQGMGFEKRILCL
jgi:hypothetical protein